MLDQSLKDQVVSLFSNLINNYTLKVELASSHPSKNELIELLTEVAACSDKVDLDVSEGTELSLRLLKNGEDVGINFRAVPTGHEFSTLLLAVLNMDGIGKNLPDETVTARIKALKGYIELKSYISLTCTNCPDVAQVLNVMTMLNPNIKHEIIDGGINEDEIKALSIQAVPTVYINGELLHVGRSSMGELLSKIEEKSGTDFNPSDLAAKEYDVIVAGGGPAGISAAIYSARKGFSVAIVAEQVGGQLNETLAIDNMISIPQTTGSKLTANLRSHLGEYEIDVLENRKIESTAIVDGLKQVKTSLGETFVAPALVIATGASWRRLNVPGEKEYIGSGVAFCAHCDGPFYKNKRVAVIGGGNSGLEAAIDLAGIASHVTVLEFMPELKGDQVLQDKLNELSHVNIITNAQTLSIEGDGSKVTSLKYKNRENDEEETLELDGVFVQIGLVANSKVFTDVVEMNKFGEIVIDAHCRTNKPGIYAAGDVSVVPYKQIVIAMGEGSKAALSAFEDKIKGKLIAN
jgi:alkyl hydroperoxide reductase subunit F